MRRAPATSSLRYRVPLLVAVGLVLLATATATVATTAVASTAAASAVSLVDDHGGASLFSASGLSPGSVQAACVGLTAGGSTDPATEVTLSADVAPGGLSPYLQLWVEQGSVPPGGTCGDFTGVAIWSGTLDRFPAIGTAGVATGWHPALTSRRVYRFTVTVLDDPRAQALRASATFRWSLTEAAPPPVPVPPPTPATGPTTAAPSADAPRSTAPATGSTSEAAPPVPTTPPTDPPTAPPSTPVPTAGGRPRAVVEAPPIASGPAAAVQAALAVAGEAAQEVGRTAVAVAHNGQFPLALVGVIAAFLFLQGRLDRRDPKLALARVREELSEYRDFPEPPPTETT